MRELSRDWQTTAKALQKSEKLELSEDGMKVNILENYFSKIRASK